MLPGYEVGGDWFDYVENSDGAWIGVADTKGKGTTAAALGGVSLGAFRAKRRVNARLDAPALAIHHTMQEVAVAGACVSVVIGRWQGPSSTFSSITCGPRPPLLVSDGVLDRRTRAGEPFGLNGVRAALAGAHDAAAASTVRALEDAITAASSDPLEDDATIVVFAPTSSQMIAIV